MKKNILILCGGVSAEHEVSIMSAKNIINAINKNQFNPILAFISRTGTWYAQTDSSIIDKITKCEEPFLYGKTATLLRNINETVLLTLSGTTIKIDAVFPIIHGPQGEDGCLQGLFEIMNLPYVGSGVLSSAIGMDKDFLKRIWSLQNIPIVPYICLNDQYNIDYKNACEQLESTILFVKPALMGSSIGVKKIKSQDEFNLAINQAFKYSKKVFIEKFIHGRELECSILGTNNPQASCIGEIKPNHEFYSYEAKYIDPNGAQLIIPAKITNAISEQIKAIALKAYKAIECSGLARVDFFLSYKKDEIYVNEINTLPGFTSISMYPKLWQASGINYETLISNLVELACEEHIQKQKICLVPDNN